MKQSNKINLKMLETVLDIRKTLNMSGEEEYNSFRIVRGHNEVNNDCNVLYFPIYITKEDDNGGWYINNSDARVYINNIIKENPRYTYVIEPDMLDNIEDKEAKFIVVDNIMESIDKLFHYYLDKSRAKTILVTGSVGKTSTVGIIEKVINDNVLRIYSKRITPVVLKANIINYLTEDIRYIVMEAGMFYRHHVKYFSEMLKPFISIFLDVMLEHQGVDNINTIEDIVKSKMEIFRYCKYALINMDDEELKKIEFKKDRIIYKDKEIITNIHEVYNIFNKTLEIEPYIKTKLSLIQYGAAIKVGEILGLEHDLIVERLSNILPVENRVNKKTIYGKEIIFDGDVSGVIRFNLFTDHYYDKAILVIRYLTTGGEEDEDYKKLVDLFSRFDKVYIFRDVVWKDILKASNVVIVDNHEFLKKVSKDTAIFYHYGSYYRKFDEFNITNLEREVE